MNELLLVISLIFTFGSVVLFYKLFGKMGLFCFSAVATVLANLEVGILVEAFGMEQTLGNVLFAATFLATDILSECESKKDAARCVHIGIFSSLFFLVISGSWLLYVPSVNDTVSAYLISAVAKTPRIILASLAVYAVVQFFDVWLYHRIWAFTEKRVGNKKKLMWLRNNLATMTSQLLNATLFNLLAFGGMYETGTLISVIASGFLIAIFTSLLDTPALYLARRLAEKKKV